MLRHLPLRHRHCTRVVHEQIQLRLIVYLRCKCAHRTQACEIQHFSPHFGRWKLAPNALDGIVTF
jgi:hypothetical protein